VFELKIEENLFKGINITDAQALQLARGPVRAVSNTHNEEMPGQEDEESTDKFRLDGKHRTD
jgi:hypothetical protein